jgi:hypothetical protein
MNQLFNTRLRLVAQKLSCSSKVKYFQLSTRMLLGPACVINIKFRSKIRLIVKLQNVH